MPVKGAVLKHKVTFAANGAGPDFYHVYSQEYHPDDYMDCMQSCHHVVEPEKQQFPAGQVLKYLRSGIKIVFELVLPFKILVDHEDPSQNKRQKYEEEGQPAVTLLNSRECHCNGHTAYKEHHC